MDHARALGPWAASRRDRGERVDLGISDIRPPLHRRTCLSIPERLPSRPPDQTHRFGRRCRVCTRVGAGIRVGRDQLTMAIRRRDLFGLGGLGGALGFLGGWAWPGVKRRTGASETRTASLPLLDVDCAADTSGPGMG